MQRLNWPLKLPRARPNDRVSNTGKHLTIPFYTYASRLFSPMKRLENFNFIRN